MVNHDSRSVLNTDEDKLVLRKELALQFAFSDAKVNGAYGKHKNTMMAFNYTYIALHLALSSKKKRAIHYLLKGISFYPGVIFSRRFLAIVKHLL
jgi:trehalose-6-phosphatase